MKKFLCMMMAVLMVLAMAACGGEPANNGGNDTPDATTVKIGGIGPLTGAYANYGLSEKNGAELAVKEINEAGGIAGKQIELSYQDSQGESESAVNAYGKLMDWGMNISLGGVLSGETASIVAAARDDDVLLITPSGSADKCIDGNSLAFRVCFYDSFQGAAAAQYIKDNDIVDVEIQNSKPTRFYNVQVRVREDFNTEMHIDTDDANACAIKTGDRVVILEK